MNTGMPIATSVASSLVSMSVGMSAAAAAIGGSFGTSDASLILRDEPSSSSLPRASPSYGLYSYGLYSHGSSHLPCASSSYGLYSYGSSRLSRASSSTSVSVWIFLIHLNAGAPLERHAPSAKASPPSTRLRTSVTTETGGSSRMCRASAPV